MSGSKKQIVVGKLKSKRERVQEWRGRTGRGGEVSTVCASFVRPLLFRFRNEDGRKSQPSKVWMVGWSPYSDFSACVTEGKVYLGMIFFPVRGRTWG